MNLRVRLLQEEDLPRADRIFRLAFGTFQGVPDPERFGGDIDKIHTRWLADPTAAFGAASGGALVGSNFATHWGSVGYFGPLTVHPDFWDRGIAQKLLEPILARLTAWGCRHTGLYTYPHSPKHLTLYQKFGFWPRFLTAIMALAVRLEAPAAAGGVTRYSAAGTGEQPGLVQAASRLTDAIYPGLDVQREIRAIESQKLGDTLMLWDEAGLAGFAALHCGPGTEAGSHVCFIKFGAARPGPQAVRNFDRLLAACETFAASRGARRLVAGTSLSREAAYRQMRDWGFRPEILGVCLHRPNEPGYHRPDALVIDDWR